MSDSVGIDVCKQWLDVHVHDLRQARRFANSAAGLRQVCAWLGSMELHQVVLEATGSYAQMALDALHAAGPPVVRLNPRQGRDFARATGQFAKTDRLDARVLAQMAAVLSLRRYQPLGDWRRALRAYQQRRTQVLAIVQQQRQQVSPLIDAWRIAGHPQRQHARPTGGWPCQLIKTVALPQERGFDPLAGILA